MNKPRPGRARNINRPDFNSPPRLPRRRPADGHIAPASDQRAGNSKPRQFLDRLVDRIPLRDPAQIKPHVGRKQSHRMMRPVQPHKLVAHRPPGPRQSHRVRHQPRPPRLAPKVHVRPHRHVERPVASLGQFLRAMQHGPQVRTYAHFQPLPRRPRQPAQLAVRIVIAHDVVERPDSFERRRRCQISSCTICRIQNHSERHPHLRAKVFKPFQRRRRLFRHAPA